MEAVPLLLNNVKAEPPEDLLATDHFQTQTEPVDLSINKARSSPRGVSSSPLSITTSVASPSSNSSSSSSRPASSPTVITTVPSTASVPTVLTPGPLVASASGVGGQQFLHIIHPVPPSSPMNLQSTKLSHVHRIPVVVQSVPVVYTAVRSPGSMNSTIVVPLLEDGRSHLKDSRRREARELGSDIAGIHAECALCSEQSRLVPFSELLIAPHLKKDVALTFDTHCTPIWRYKENCSLGELGLLMLFLVFQHSTTGFTKIFLHHLTMAIEQSMYEHNYSV
ncbi:Krueppel-like factor 12 [Anomaloglossus baeobatrachus]|uniref:Krueppel-like factor 12 n=1 Tax=Anomaloglossus baeobatrachus TaxID=238106 RepID=UPI003F4FCA52